MTVPSPGVAESTSPSTSGSRRPNPTRRPRFAPTARGGRVRLSMRRTGLLASLVVAVIALTGCVTVQLDATVHTDGTLSGTARFGVSKTLSAVAGGEDALRQQLKSEDSCDFGSKNGTVKNYDDGTYIGIECTFSGVTMAEFNSGEDGPKLAKNGNKFQLSGQLNLLDSIDSQSGLLGGGGSGSGSASASGSAPALPSGLPTDLSSLLPSGLPTDLGSFLPSNLPSEFNSLFASGVPTDLNSLLPSGLPTDLSSLLPSGLPTALGSSGGLLDPQAILKTAKIQFAFTFPGKVESSKGKVSGNKVVFTPDSSGNIDFTTTAAATPSSSTNSALIWLPIAVALLLLVVLATVLLRRRRNAQPAPAGGPAFDQSQYGQPGYAPPGYGQPGYGQPGYGQPGYGQPDQPTYQTPGPHPPQPYQAPQPYQQPSPYQPPPPYQPPQPTQPYEQPPPERPDGPDGPGDGSGGSRS